MLRYDSPSPERHIYPLEYNQTRIVGNGSSDNSSPRFERTLKKGPFIYRDLPQEDSDYEREKTPPSPPPRKYSRRGASLKLKCIGKQDSDENPLMNRIAAPLKIAQTQENDRRNSQIRAMAVAGMSVDNHHHHAMNYSNVHRNSPETQHRARSSHQNPTVRPLILSHGHASRGGQCTLMKHTYERDSKSHSQSNSQSNLRSSSRNDPLRSSAESLFGKD